MITTVTLNPMLDKTVIVDAVRLGAITRAHRIETIVGGKGVNVSRQLRRLGHPTRIVWFRGGEIGAMLARLLCEEDLHHEPVDVAGMTREGVTYRDAQGTATSVFEPPHAVTPEEVQRLVSACAGLTAGSSWVVCCGSSPAKQADAAYREILENARHHGTRTAVDSYGRAMTLAVKIPADIVKMNVHEYAASFGTALTNEADILHALRLFVDGGSMLALLTDGDKPAYAATSAGQWRIVPPRISSVNPTGSGDSMLAGLLYGLEQGWDIPASLRFGAAAGAANAGRWDVAVSSRTEIDELAPFVHIEMLDE